MKKNSLLTRAVVPLCDIFLHNQLATGRDHFRPLISSSNDSFNIKKAVQKKRKLESENEIKNENEVDEKSDEDGSETDEYDNNENEPVNDPDYDPDHERQFLSKMKKEEKNYRDELSEYEKMVQKNREEKMAFLQALKIDEVKEDLKEAVNNVKSRKYKKQKIKTFNKPAKRLEITPTRKSRRLAKLDVNLSEEALYQKALTTAVKEEQEKILPQHYSFKDASEDEQNYSDFLNNFKFNASTNETFNNEYVSRFKHMKLEEKNIAKVVPVRISALSIHPSTDRIIVIAGSKYGQLGFWNVTSESNPVVFTPHNAGITNIRVNPNITEQIVSSSYDGTLRSGNIEKKVFTEIYNVSEETSCTYFDFLSPTTLLVSLRNGKISVIDVRNESLKSDKKHDCHDYPVKTVSVHPVKKNLFLTSDSKGVLKLWDLRKLQKKPVISVPHHKRSISSAFFSPLTGNSILTTSLDDTLCIFDSTNLEKEILYDVTIKHNNCTGRWLSPFKAMWLPNSDDTFVVGSMLYPRRIEIYNKRNNIYNFYDENLSSVTSLTQFHPSLNVLSGANSSGKVFVFIDTDLNF